ncbi:hypothetical protein [Streptosporangium saharense]|uniref:Uncharacterized protein n=1 Tax=Streptosporangium saharense TaxID=1706840 RepID=A0A7W7QHG5_9ACTN|nr:hypothetical protein [Streptosporangium saharense]MBB4913459.1 hypothetical protein [Streptosporangium saharense]
MTDALRRKMHEGFYDPKAPQLRHLQSLLARLRVETVFVCEDGAPRVEVPGREVVIWTDRRERIYFWKHQNERALQVPVEQAEEAARQIADHLTRLAEASGAEEGAPS